MREIDQNIEVLCHSCIRIEGSSRTIYVDPFGIEGQPHDADIILLTHEHPNHFSKEDIDKVTKEGTRIVAPEGMRAEVDTIELQQGKKHYIVPGGIKETRKMFFKAIPAYYKHKLFATKKNPGVGYVFELDGVWIYVAGDTDLPEERMDITCDIVLVPICGKNVMDAKKAAEFVNNIRPQIAIPIHYGTVCGTREDAEKFASYVYEATRVSFKLLQ